MDTVDTHSRGWQYTRNFSNSKQSQLTDSHVSISSFKFQL